MRPLTWEAYKQYRETNENPLVRFGRDQASKTMATQGAQVGNPMKAKTAAGGMMGDDTLSPAATALGDKMAKNQLLKKIVATLSANMKTTVGPAFLKNGMRREQAAQLIGPELVMQAVQSGLAQYQGDMIMFNV